MSDLSRRVEQVFTVVAVVAVVVALIGAMAVGVAFLKALALEGYDLPFAVPLAEGDIEFVGIAGGAALLGGFVTYVLAGAIAGLVGGYREGATTPSGGDAHTEPAETMPASERFRAKLQRFYAFVAGTVWLLAVGAALGGVASGGDLSLGAVALLAFARIAVVVFFGTLVGAVVAAAVLTALWYGIRQRATEALLGSFVVAFLFLSMGLVARSLGFVFVALWLTYYAFFARGSTRWIVAESTSVPPAVRGFLE